MELVVARIDELRVRLTEAFERWAGDGPGDPKRLPPPQLSCALSGGATALIFLGALKNATVDWSRISLFWADERAVPANDLESIYGIAIRARHAELNAKPDEVRAIRRDGAARVPDGLRPHARSPRTLWSRRRRD